MIPSIAEQRRNVIANDPIADEILTGSSINVKFEGIHFKLGFIIADRQIEDTASWLKSAVLFPV